MMRQWYALDFFIERIAWFPISHESDTTRLSIVFAMITTLGDGTFGAVSDEITDEELIMAPEFRPHLVSVIKKMNDKMFDLLFEHAVSGDLLGLVQA